MRIGIDLGGTKIEAAALDAAGVVVARQRIDTPSENARSIVDAVAKLVRAVERELGQQCTVGVATPGALSPATGRMKNSNTVCLNGQPLDRMLCEALQREVRLANDANCFALSEAVDGAASDARVVFGVILGTGTGGGIVVEQRLVEGPNRVAGEWGHNPLPWSRDDDEPAAACYCGRRGCIETYVSGPALERDHQAQSGAVDSARSIAEAAARADGAARASLERYLDRLARSLAAVVNVLDPDAVVLGGGLSNIDALYLELPPRIERYAFSDALDLRLVKNQHGDSSGVRGAAWLHGLVG